MITQRIGCALGWLSLAKAPLPRLERNGCLTMRRRRLASCIPLAVRELDGWLKNLSWSVGGSGVEGTTA